LAYSKAARSKTFYFPVMALVHVIGISTRNLSFEKKTLIKTCQKGTPSNPPDKRKTFSSKRGDGKAAWLKT
jgi:hypothetical protein